MQINILIGGYAGQGINLVSGIVSKILSNYGYFTFNYRDYQSLIRGGHNFNVLSISDTQIESHGSKMDIIIALDERTITTHKQELTSEGLIIDSKEFEKEGRNLNIALAGKLIKVLGIPYNFLEEEISLEFKGNKDTIASAKRGYDSDKDKFGLKKLKNSATPLAGSEALAIGATNSNLDVYIAYPMSPSTNALHEMAKKQVEKKMLVFQPEGEIAGVTMAMGASYAGAKTMIGTSGGGFDLMTETFSMQGMSQVPLTVYLASRPGPGTGLPTYTCQGDLDLALRCGHGEFPRVVVAPGNPIELIEKTSESLFLAEKYKMLSIILADKHLAECEFSSTQKPAKAPEIKITRPLPGKGIARASSYESDEKIITTEDGNIAEKNANERTSRYEEMKKYINENFEMTKMHGKQESENLIIGWGSTSGAIKDAIKDLDAKFLQVLYVKPLSDKIREEMQKAKRIILVELNQTGQLGRLIREKTGIKIENRLLKYDGRPFCNDELKAHLKEML